MNVKENTILEVDNLKTTFHTLRGEITAVDGVSFCVNRGEILGIVGESGCGKSVTSQSIMRLYDEKKLVKYQGKINFNGENLLEKSEKDMEAIRGNKIAMIFQDSLSALNPLLTVGNQLMEPLRIHQRMTKEQAKNQAVELLRQVGIPAPEERMHSYPFEMSGGMRQRAMIAMALACHPQLLIADEPTTALDVTMQAQIMNLIIELNKKEKMGIMLITHDLGVVAQTCQRVIVMYLGHIVEEGTVEDIFDRPLHPYTKGLLKSIPTLDTKKNQDLYIIKGTVPALNEVGEGCRFCGRCPYEKEMCRKQDPELEDFNKSQKVRCFFAKEIQGEEVGI